MQEKEDFQSESLINNEDLKIVKVDRFTLYKVKYIINKKNTFRFKDEDFEYEEEKKSLLNKNKKEPKKLNLNIEDNEMGIENINNKEDRKGNDSSLISQSSHSSDSEGSNSEK